MDIYIGFAAGLAVLLVSSVVAAMAAGNSKLAGWLNFIFCLLAAGVFTVISAVVVTNASGTQSCVVHIGPVNLHILIDGFSALFMVLISVMAVVTSLYSIPYMEHYKNSSMRSYYINFPLFMMGMICIVTTDDLSIGFSIAWQLMTVSSYFLIRFDVSDRSVIRSATKYIVLMELAWLLVLAGAWLIPGCSIGDPSHQLTANIGEADGSHRILIYALMLAGFALKAGVFPFGQIWMPDAYSASPSPISALLSGAFSKTGVYGIIRTLFWMLPASVAQNDGKIMGLVVACLGVVTLFIGTVQALKQHDSKRLHAYHSIGQIGYIVLGIGSALYFYYSGSEFMKVLSIVALLGAVYHTVNHTVFKGLLFLCTGSVEYATGAKDLNQLGGLIRFMPVTTVIAAIASASIAGVPAFSGFMSKWAVISSNLLASNQAGVCALFGIVALMTSAITLASYVKFFGMTFTSSGIEWSKKDVREVGGIMLVSKSVLAILCVIQGIFPFIYMNLFMRIFAQSEGSIIRGLFADSVMKDAVVSSVSGITVSIPGSSINSATAMPVLLALVFFATYILVYLFKKSGGAEEKTADVWLCGYQHLNDLNRYKSSGMYAAFKKFMKWTGGNVS